MLERTARKLKAKFYCGGCANNETDTRKLNQLYERQAGSP